HDAGDGLVTALVPEAFHGVRREFGHAAMQEIPELPVALLEAKLVTVGGQMRRVETVGTQARPTRLPAPDRGRGAIAEKAGADQHAGIVVEVEGGGTDFDGHDGDGGVRV